MYFNYISKGVEKRHMLCEDKEYPTKLLIDKDKNFKVNLDYKDKVEEFEQTNSKLYKKLIFSIDHDTTEGVIAVSHVLNSCTVTLTK